MITDSDMRYQVEQALADEAGDFNVPAIVDEIQRKYGTVHVDRVPNSRFWEIVQHHAR